MSTRQGATVYFFAAFCKILTAADGLRSVSAVLAHLAAKPNDVKQPGAVIRDLKAIEATLTAAAAAGVAFHLTRAEAAA